MSWATRHARRLCGVALLLGCPASSSDAEEDDPVSLQIAWAGCAPTADRGLCEIDDRRPLKVWVPSELAGGHWMLDGMPLLAETTTEVDGGVRLEFPRELPVTSSVELELLDASGKRLFELELRPYRLATDQFSFHDEFTEVLESGDPIRRRALAERMVSEAESGSPLQRLARLHYARLLYGKQDRAGFERLVRPLLSRIRQVSDAAGRWGEKCAAAKVALYYATRLRQPDIAARWTPLAAPCAARSDELAAEFDYYIGNYALGRRDYAQAETRLLWARRFARRLDTRFSWLASKRYVEVFIRTGRWTEAQREVKALESESLETCQRALLDSDVGYYRLEARRRGEADLGDPRPHLLRALRLHQPGAECEDAAARDHDLIKLAQVAAVRRDRQGLSTWVGAIDRRTLAGKYRTQYAELQVELALLGRDADSARAALQELEAWFDDATDQELRWRFHMLQARLAGIHDDSEAAIEAYQAAEAALDRAWENVRSGAIRERWLGGFRRSALRLTAHLLTDGRTSEAACAARTARARGLSRAADPPVDARTPLCGRAWARHPHELVFFIVPQETAKWWVFTIVDERIADVRSVDPVSPTTALTDAPRWWDPWSEALRHSERVRILASHEALQVPLHDLGWGGRPLGQARPVDYGLDLDPSAVARAEDSPAALIAFSDADPLRTLGRYRPRVRAVTTTLTELGWAATELDGTVRPDQLVDAMPPGGLFHYYGHGLRDRPGSETVQIDDEDVGSTALLLDGERRWSTDDVLTLPNVPRWVVLLGCRVGFSDRRGWNGGLNLAHAFLLAGASEVMAPSRTLDASAAAALGPALYAQQTSNDLDLASSLHELWAQQSPSDPDTPWRDLRVWTP